LDNNHDIFLDKGFNKLHTKLPQMGEFTTYIKTYSIFMGYKIYNMVTSLAHV